MIRAVRESVTSAGTRDVPNKSNVEMMRCRVERVDALRDLSFRHAMERLCESRGQSNEKGLVGRRLF